MQSYATVLMLCALLAAVCGQGQHRVSALVVILNFAANQAFVSVSGNTTAWHFFSAVDVASLLVLTFPMSGRVGAILASTYCVQVLMHWSYGISSGASPYLYWQGLTAVAWLQLAILALGGFGSGCLRIGFVRRRFLEGASAEARESVATSRRGD